MLAGRYGLRNLLAPTTDHRAFWDAMPADALADRGDRSTVAAIAAIQRADEPPWSPFLYEALAATAQIAAVAVGQTRNTADPSLWPTVQQPRPPHPTGLPAGDAEGTCGTCVWRHATKSLSRCRHTLTRIDPAWPACEHYEAALDCQTCGACCRAAYHSVTVTSRDRVCRTHPELVVDRGTYLDLARTDDHCTALTGGEADGERVARYHCTIYDDRPKTCRDFAVGGEHCLTARRRVALTLGLA